MLLEYILILIDFANIVQVFRFLSVGVMFFFSKFKRLSAILSLLLINVLHTYLCTYIMPIPVNQLLQLNFLMYSLCLVCKYAQFSLHSQYQQLAKNVLLQFFRFQHIFETPFARLLDSSDVMFISPCHIIKNVAFDECRVSAVLSRSFCRWF